MVHRDQHVLARVRGQRFLQSLEARGAEPAGILAGEKLGASAHAALVTRGFAELRRFGPAKYDPL